MDGAAGKDEPPGAKRRTGGAEVRLGAGEYRGVRMGATPGPETIGSGYIATPRHHRTASAAAATTAAASRASSAP